MTDYTDSTKSKTFSKPLVSFTLMLIIGILISYYTGWGILIWLSLGIILLAALFSTLIWQKNRKLMPVYIILFLALILGGIRFRLEDKSRAEAINQIKQWSSKGELTVQGNLRTLPELTPKGSYWKSEIMNVEVTLKNRHYSLPTGVIVMHKFPLPAGVTPGDFIRVTGYLQRFQPNAVPGEYNAREYSMIKNLGAIIWINAPEKLVYISSPKKSLGDYKRKVIGWIRNRSEIVIQNAVPEPYDSLLQAIILGNRSDMPKDKNDNLRNSGMLHLTAVSGLHITLVMVIFAWLLKLCGLRRTWAFGLTLILLFIFVNLVGWKPSAVRAGIMGTVLIIGWLLQKETSGLNSLSLAALITIFINPYYLFQIGFQLSYLIVFTLILLMKKPHGDEGTGRTGHLWRYIYSGIKISLVAFIGGFPLIWFYFHQIVSINVFANLVCVPLVTIVLALSVVMLMIGTIWTGIAFILGPVIHYLLIFFDKFVGICASIPYGHFSDLIPLPFVLIPAWYLMIVWIVTPDNKFKWQWKWFHFNKTNFGLAALAYFIWISLFFPNPGLLKIDFLSAGQGDSTVIRFPKGGTMIIDGGGSKSPVLVPYLINTGIRHINMILLSHPESDHIGEIPQVLKKFPVDYFLYNGDVNDTSPYRELISVLESKPDTKVFIVHEDQEIIGVPGVKFTFLHPSEGLVDIESVSQNEASVVAQMDFCEFSVLFTGDIGTLVESDLLREYPYLDCDILKVPHHGSRYSSSEEFINRITPEASIIMVGKNSYGHPAKETLNRLYDSGSLVFQTNKSGTVQDKNRRSFLHDLPPETRLPVYCEE